MEVHHKPKTWQGSREFLKEIGTIVIGVLIALVGEQVVQAAHHHFQVGDLRRALNQELAWNLLRLKEYADESGCATERLDVIDRWSRSLQSGHPLKLDGPILSPPGLIFRTAVWRSAGGATIDQMPLDQRIAYAQFYDGVANNDRERSRAAELWDQLSEFEGASSLTPDQLREISHDIAKLRGLTRSLVGNYNTWRTAYAPPLGVRIEDAPSTDQTGSFLKPAQAAFCRPLQAR